MVVFAAETRVMTPDVRTAEPNPRKPSPPAAGTENRDRERCFSEELILGLVTGLVIAGLGACFFFASVVATEIAAETGFAEFVESFIRRLLVPYQSDGF